ncbi:MAG TPA: ATP-binding protein [Solirubrobacteraceae bacterium]|jgi:stage II sporulation protein AB (anti-sigma F factor)|nr:ATP-binding protein [Solirubrobacteraceae bacterium]
MQAGTTTFTRSYEAEPASVGLARAELAAFAAHAGASEPLLDGVRLAVSEAVTNAVRHAYPLDPGEIRVHASVGGEALDVVVADDGCGVHSGDDGGGLGLGLAVICEVSDEMTLAPRADGGTEVRMRFSLLESGSGAPVGPL